MKLKKAIDWVDRWEMIPPGATVLCAVSGGRDSVVLLHFLHTLGQTRGFSVAAAHYNHRLRPTADRDEQFVRDFAAARGIPCRCGGGDVASYCAENGLSTEEGARRLRYAFLEQARREMGAEVIATGHHLADQAETVLLNLIRGTGADGLRGIAPVYGRLIRPLLEVTPGELAAYAAANGLPWVEDETNGDLGYARNRLRRQVLPELLAVNSAALENIHRAARTLAEEDLWLEETAALALQELGDPADYNEFRKKPLPLRRRMVRLLLDRLPAGKRDITAVHIDGIACLGRGGYLSLPGGIYAAVEQDRLTVAVAEEPPAPVALSMGETVRWGDWQISLLREAPAGGDCLLLPAELADRLAVGPWDPAGRMETERGRRSMKRVFTDCRIPVSRRNRYPVLYAGGEPLAILSLTEAVLRENTEACIAIQWYSK